MGCGALIRRRLLLLAALASLVTAGFSAFVWAQRRALPYNAEGRFFDESTATVLHEQSVAVYAVFAAGLAVVGAGLLALSRRR